MKKLFSSLVLAVLLFTACSGGSRTEKERFVDATVEVTCMVFQSDDLLDPALEEKTKEVFASHGFDVDDEEAMKEIAAKYENDADLQTAVETALTDCAGDLFEAFGDAFAAPEADTEE